jgi:hypothetical protein
MIVNKLFGCGISSGLASLEFPWRRDFVHVVTYINRTYKDAIIFHHPSSHEFYSESPRF